MNQLKYYCNEHSSTVTAYLKCLTHEMLKLEQKNFRVVVTSKVVFLLSNCNEFGYHARSGVQDQS